MWITLFNKCLQYSNKGYICVTKASNMTTQTLNIAASFLNSFFPKSEVNYSLGFTRMMKLNRKQSLNAFTALFLEGFTEIKANNEELKKRLSAMTEEEFKTFKKQ
jgi:hypothetical protein